MWLWRTLNRIVRQHAQGKPVATNTVLMKQRGVGQ